MTIKSFGVKLPNESVILTFDFSGGLEDDETLTGVDAVTVLTAKGTDENPQSILNGAASLSPGARWALVPVKAGPSPCSYRIKVTAQTSNPKKVLELVAILPVMEPA
jgi:hypothetical protein